MINHVTNAFLQTKMYEQNPQNKYLVKWFWIYYSGSMSQVSLGPTRENIPYFLKPKIVQLDLIMIVQVRFFFTDAQALRRTAAMICNINNRQRCFVIVRDIRQGMDYWTTDANHERCVKIEEIEMYKNVEWSISPLPDIRN